MLALARRGALPLYAALRERRVTHLVAGEAAVARLPLDDPAFERCFRPLWSGDGGRLWELAERCGEAPSAVARRSIPGWSTDPASGGSPRC